MTISSYFQILPISTRTLSDCRPNLGTVPQIQLLPLLNSIISLLRSDETLSYRPRPRQAVHFRAIHFRKVGLSLYNTQTGSCWDKPSVLVLLLLLLLWMFYCWVVKIASPCVTDFICGQIVQRNGCVVAHSVCPSSPPPKSNKLWQGRHKGKSNLLSALVFDCFGFAWFLFSKPHEKLEIQSDLPRRVDFEECPNGPSCLTAV